MRLGADHPTRLAHISALIALGARAAAGQSAGGGTRSTDDGDQAQPAERAPPRWRVEAQTELAVTGSRRRSDILWGPEALTPSERRVAELAVEGLTTREMAESLFVTPKTVEFHLRHIYQKLGVNSRDKLGGALGIENGPRQR